MSVAQLLGGSLREAVPAYASLHNYTPAPDLSDELASALRAAKVSGFKALKMKIGGRPLREDLRYLRLAREVAGDNPDLVADANQTYTVPMGHQSRSSARRARLRLVRRADPHREVSGERAIGVLPRALSSSICQRPPNRLSFSM